MLTVGKFAIVDIFDTNKYANNPKTDFLNWSLINAGTFDYAGDAWGYTYGAAAEWYSGQLDVPRRRVRPVGDAGRRRPECRPLTVSTRPSSNSSWSAKSRARYESVGPAGQDQGHRLSQPRQRRRFPGRHRSLAADRAVCGDPSNALASVRTYQSRPGVSLNLEQQ